MKKLYLNLFIFFVALTINAQVEYTYSLNFVGATGTGGNYQVALMLNGDSGSTSNSLTADFGVSLSLPSDYTIGNFVAGNAGFQFFEFNVQSESPDGSTGYDIIQLQRTDIIETNFTHASNVQYELVRFDIIAQNGASQLPTTGTLSIEDIDAGINDTYFNINISEDVAGTLDYLATSNFGPFSSINFSTLSTPETELQGISVYPNPVKDILNITGIENLKRIEILNINGQLINTVDSNLNTVDMSGLSSGIYFAKLTTTNASKTIKVIKE